MSGATRRPARLSRGVATGAALVALGSSGLYAWTSLAVGGAGVALLVGGLVRGRTAAVSVGAFGLFAGATVAGAYGAPVVPVLVSVTAAVLAWDAGTNAISVGDQLGREADTTRLEAVHVAGTLVVGAVTASVGYGLYQIGSGSRPAAALASLLLAAILLIVALD